MRWVKRLFGLRLYNKDDVAALIQRNVRLREHNRRVIELEWKASFSEMQMEGLERESKRRREAESERFKSDKALKAAARVFAERETDLLHRISALESIVDRLPKTSRWVVSSETTPSGKTLFKCGSCFRLSVGPDKKCPSGCDAWDGLRFLECLETFRERQGAVFVERRQQADPVTERRFMGGVA